MEQYKVEQLENKNQFLIRGKNNLIFQSYDSTIAILENGATWALPHSLTLGRYWDYSNTTRKHLYIFLQRYCNIAQVRYALQSTNKRKAIQDLIDQGIINYNEGLE